MKAFLLAWALVMPALSWAAAPPGISCKTGGAAAVDSYHRALALRQAGTRLTTAQEQEVVRLLGAALTHRCSKAALALADIKARQAASDSADAARAGPAQLDEEIHALLLQAETEGDLFELGRFYLTTRSKFNAPGRAMALLEQAAGEGNGHAAEFFFNLFDQRTALAGEAAPASYQQARTVVGAIDFRVTVDVVERQGCAFAQITHRNAGQVAMYFEPLEPLLRISDASGSPLPATGIIADGPPFLPEDYVKLLPGAHLMREVALNSSYALKKAGTYQLEVNGDYDDPRLLQNYPQGGNIVRTFKYAGLCKKVSLE